MRLVVLAILSCVSGAVPAPTSDANTCADVAEKGQLLKIKGKLREARSAFLECVKDACPPLVRKDCAQFLVDLEAATPSVVLAAREPSGSDLTDVRVLVDGELLATRLEGKALPMDPGVHKFRFESKGRVAVEQTIVVREGERNRVISVTLAPEQGPEPPVVDKPSAPVGAWIAASVAVVGLGTFTAFGLSARAEFNELKSTCGTRCPESEVDRVRTRALVADVGLAIGLLGAGVATYLFIDHARKPSVQPVLGAGWLGVAGNF